MSIAVELLVNAANPFARSHDRKKIEYLCRNGWLVIYIWIRGTEYLTKAHATYIRTLYDALGTNPSIIGQYRVIGRNVNVVSAGCFDDDDESGIGALI